MLPRVLFLAALYPRPANPLMGTWAQSQARALHAAGVDLTVVSLNAWIPPIAASWPRARSFAHTPAVCNEDGFPVHYPGWLYYSVDPLKRWSYPNPRPWLEVGLARAKRELTRIVEEARPDVVFAHHTCIGGFVAHWIKQHFGIAYVTLDHDFDEIADCRKLPLRFAHFERIARGASAMCAVAARMERDLRRLFPYVRTATVHNGVAPIPAHLLTIPRPVELLGKRIVLCAGMFYTRKGIPLLIEAFAKVAGRHPDAILRIVGDATKDALSERERAAIHRAIAASGVKDRIELRGLIPRQELFQEMVWSDVFALVGWNEPLATVFIEAMAAGKPVITASDGGINDLVRDGVHGRAVPPHSVDAVAAALDALLGDADARKRMGAAALNLYESRLTPQANAAQLLTIFDAARGAVPTSHAA